MPSRVRIYLPYFSGNHKYDILPVRPIRFSARSWCTTPPIRLPRLLLHGQWCNNVKDPLLHAMIPRRCHLSSALMFAVTEASTTSRIYGYSVVLAISTGLFVQASFSFAQAKVKRHEIPLVVGFITCAQIDGVKIISTIANSIVLNQSARQIHQLLPDVPLEIVR